MVFHKKDSDMLKKRFLYTSLFILIALSFIYLLSPVLNEKDEATNLIIRDFKTSLKEPVDIYVLGSSHARTVFGAQLLKDYGLHVFSAGTAYQPWMTTYYLLDQICQKNDNEPELVIFNISRLFSEYSSSSQHLVFDKEYNIFRKLKFMLYSYSNIYKFENKSFLQIAGLVFPFINYHDRWSKIKKEDFYEPISSKLCFLGAFINPIHRTFARSDFVLEEKETVADTYDHIVEEEYSFFEACVKRCQEKNIDVLLIQTPSALWNNGRHIQVQKIADKYRLPFLDFNLEYLYDQCNIEAQKDFYDENHLNAFGALKLTDVLGKYISENYPDITHKELTEKDNDILMRYEKALDSIKIETISNNNYKDINLALRKVGYEVLIQMNGKVNGIRTEDALSWLESAGLTVDLMDERNVNFLGLMKDGKLIYEEVSSEPITYKNHFSDGVSYKIYSNIDRNATPVMTINGERVFFSGFGLNVLIYDSTNSRIVRMMTFDNSDGKLKIS